MAASSPSAGGAGAGGVSAGTGGHGLLFEGVRVFVEVMEAQEERLRQTLTRHGAVLLDRPDDANNYYHIIDRSNWKRLQELQAKRVKILGPKCIYDSVSLKKRIPDASKHPIFCRTFDGLKICCTSLSTAQRTETEEMVKCMNGSYSVELTSRTDYLVATEVGSPKYQVALERNIPIVKPSWVSSAWKAQAIQPLKEHLLPPFAGCIISVTNLSSGTRNTIERLVTTYGGVYSPDLTNSCTHLISPLPMGLKYKYATIWGIHVVTLNWLLDSVNAFGNLDPSKYVPNLGAPYYTGASSSGWTSSSVVQRLGQFLPTIGNNRGQTFQTAAFLRTGTPGKRSVGFAVNRSSTGDGQTELREQMASKRPRLETNEHHLVSEGKDGLSTGSTTGNATPTSPLGNGSGSIASSSNSAASATVEPSATTASTRAAALLGLNTPQISAIIELCDDITSRAIDVSNVCTLLEQSDDSTPLVRTACLNFIAKEFETVRKTPGYQQLSDSLKAQVSSRLVQLQLQTALPNPPPLSSL